MILSGAARRWNSEFYKKAISAYQHQLRRDLDEWLPELESPFPTTNVRPLMALPPLKCGTALRNIQALSKPASIEIIVEMLSALMPS